MSTNKKKDVDELKEDSQSTDELKNEDSKELSLEDKLKESEDKLLRSLAEIENQDEGSKKKLKMPLNLDRLILQKKVWLFWTTFKELKRLLKMTKYLKQIKI